MKASRAWIHQLELPFVSAFVHGTKQRAASDATVVRVQLDDGTVGHGECLARPYVTGEDVASVHETLRHTLWPAVRGEDLPSADTDVLAALTTLVPAGVASEEERSRGRVPTRPHAARSSWRSWTRSAARLRPPWRPGCHHGPRWSATAA